jgi:drug/metabolite transporter (DMT)-like permease
MNMTVKLINSSDEPVPILEIILIRSTITFILLFAYMRWKKIPDPFLGPKGVRTLLFLRGIAGFFTIWGVLFSLQYLSLPDATVLTYLTPILTGFTGALFLGEVLSLRESVAGLCSFLGVVLISRPEFLFGGLQETSGPSEATPAQRMLSVAAALIGVLGLTGVCELDSCRVSTHYISLTFISVLSLRAIGDRAHILHPVASFSSLCAVVSASSMVLFEIPLVIPTQTLGLVMLFLHTLFGLLAQVLLTIGLQYETAGRGSLALYTSIVFALVFEFTMFHTTPPPLSLIGMLIILSSAIYTTLTKKQTVKKPATHGFSKRSPDGASPSSDNGCLEA